MPSLELLCLANSFKLSQRCIAGLRTDTGEWVRPVSEAPHGELNYSQRNLGSDGDPQKFDLIQVGLAKQVPTPGQPENWLIDGTAWQLASRPGPAGLHTLVSNAIYGNVSLFGTLSDHVPAAAFAASPAKESLVLVKPQSLSWITDSYGPFKKARVLFTIAGTTYNLAVTDPLFKARIKALQIGHHKSVELGIEDEDQILFTISLGEPFQGNCYKLVAAVLIPPQGWPKTP